MVIAPAVMCWVFALAMFYLILKIHVNFVDARKRWLANLRAPRAFSTIIEKLPIANAKQTMVEEYVSKFFGRESVRRVWVVADTGALSGYHDKWKDRNNVFDIMRRWDQLDSSNTYLAVANFHDKACAEAEEAGEEHPEPDAMTHEALKLRELEFQMRTYWDRHGEWLEAPCGKTVSCVVTFNTRLSAAIASSVQMSFGKFPSTELAPGIQDVLWKKILMSRKARSTRSWVPYLAVIVFIFWLPVQLAFSQLAQPEFLQSALPFLPEDGHMVQLLSALLPTLLTNLCIAFLPNLLWVLSDYRVCSARTHRILWVSLLLHLFVFICMLLPALIGNAMRKSLQDLDVKSFFGFFSNPVEVMQSMGTSIPGAFDTFFAQYILLTGGSWYIFFLLRLGPICLFPLGWLLLRHKAYGFDLACYEAYGEGPPVLFARLSLELCIVITFAITNPICIPMFIFSVCIRYLGYKNFLLSHNMPKEDTGGQFWARHTGPLLMWALLLQQLLFIFIMVDRNMYLDNKWNEIAMWMVVPLPIITVIFYCYVFGHKLFKWKRLSLEDAIMADAGLPPRGLTVTGFLKWFTFGQQISVNLNALVDPDKDAAEALDKVNQSILLTDSFDSFDAPKSSSSAGAKAKFNKARANFTADSLTVPGADAESVPLLDTGSTDNLPQPLNATIGYHHAATLDITGAMRDDASLHLTVGQKLEKVHTHNLEHHGTARVGTWSRPICAFEAAATIKTFVQENPDAEGGSLAITGDSNKQPKTVLASGGARRLGDTPPPPVEDKLFLDKHDIKKAKKQAKKHHEDTELIPKSVAPHPHMISEEDASDDVVQKTKLNDHPEGAFEYARHVTTQLKAPPAVTSTILAPGETTIPRPRNRKDMLMDGAAGQEVEVTN